MEEWTHVERETSEESNADQRVVGRDGESESGHDELQVDEAIK